MEINEKTYELIVLTLGEKYQAKAANLLPESKRSAELVIIRDQCLGKGDLAGAQEAANFLGRLLSISEIAKLLKVQIGGRRNDEALETLEYLSVVLAQHQLSRELEEAIWNGNLKEARRLADLVYPHHRLRGGELLAIFHNQCEGGDPNSQSSEAIVETAKLILQQART